MDDTILSRFGFRIRPVNGRWEWIARGAEAGVSGFADTRAEAAAQVIRALARAESAPAGRAA